MFTSLSGAYQTFETIIRRGKCGQLEHYFIVISCDFYRQVWTGLRTNRKIRMAETVVEILRKGDINKLRAVPLRLWASLIGAWRINNRRERGIRDSQGEDLEPIGRYTLFRL